MRAGPRRALVVDGALGLGLAWLGWLGAHVAWTGPPVERHPPWSRGESEFHGWLPETPAVVPFLLLLAAGVAVRRRWPRLGFVAVVVGLGGFLALGASVGPLLLAPALVVYVCWRSGCRCGSGPP